MSELRALIGQRTDDWVQQDHLLHNTFLFAGHEAYKPASTGLRFLSWRQD